MEDMTGSPTFTPETRIFENPEPSHLLPADHDQSYCTSRILKSHPRINRNIFLHFSVLNNGPQPSELSTAMLGCEYNDILDDDVVFEEVHYAIWKKNLSSHLEWTVLPLLSSNCLVTYSWACWHPCIIKCYIQPNTPETGDLDLSSPYIRVVIRVIQRTTEELPC